MRIGSGWKTFLRAAWVVAIVLASCRKSETESARPASQADPHPPFGYIDVPRENEVVAPGSRGRGWALDDSGVASVTAALDNGPASPAELGQPYPGVKDSYPTFAGSDKARFNFVIPEAAAGPHLLVVTITGKDGGKTDLKRHVQIR